MWHLIKLKSFGTAKETTKWEDNPQTNIKKYIEENICKRCDWQGISLQNLEPAHVAQYKKNKQPQSKMGKRPK